MKNGLMKSMSLMLKLQDISGEIGLKDFVVTERRLVISISVLMAVL